MKQINNVKNDFDFLINQFSEFKDYCYFGNIGDGLKWAIENKKIAKQMVTEGQQYVLQKYNLNNICNKWKKIFEEISS